MPTPCCTCDRDEQGGEIVCATVHSKAVLPDDTRMRVDSAGETSANPPDKSSKGANPRDVPLTGRTGEPVVPEEEMPEMVRIQQLIQTFTQTAQRGCPCMFLRDSGDRIEAKYCLDKDLEHLSLHASAKDGALLASCPMASITDIYCMGDDGEEFFPRAVLSALRPSEDKRLLRVVCGESGHETCTFCILDASVASKDIFLEAMCVLTIHARSKRGERPGSP